jgi:dolichyl-phosphate beta-glucosyltransferase
MLEARGDWALFTDADLAAPIGELEKLWCAVERENAQGAIGSRMLDRSLIGVHQPPVREFAGRVFNLLVRIVTGLRLHDTQCGFKLFERSAAKAIFSRQRLHGFGFDVEALYIARRMGYSIVETAVRWSDVSGTKVSLWRGIAAYLDPVKVLWYGWRGVYERSIPMSASPFQASVLDEPVSPIRKSA